MLPEIDRSGKIAWFIHGLHGFRPRSAQKAVPFNFGRRLGYGAKGNRRLLDRTRRARAELSRRREERRKRAPVDHNSPCSLASPQPPGLCRDSSSLRPAHGRSQQGSSPPLAWTNVMQAAGSFPMHVPWSVSLSLCLLSRSIFASSVH